MAFTAKTSQRGHRSHTTDEAVAEVSKEPLKSLIIKVPESKHRQFKSLTSAQGDTMQAVLEQAIDDYLKL